jgi:high-affinity iron transporter
LVALLAAVGCGRTPTSVPALPRAGQRDAGVLRVTPTSCVGRWQPVASGPHSFVVANRGHQPLQVSFIAAGTGDIFGEITQLDPSTTRPLTVDPPAGLYRFRCVPRRGVAAVSATGRVSGTGGAPGTALVPLSAEETVDAVATYRREVRRGIDRLVPATDRLQAAVNHDRRAAAKRRWLAAHLDFASLGAAYGTFGALTDEIDGRADGLPKGVHDPGFTGFLAVERLLWHHATAAGLQAATGRLDRDVHTLRMRFPHLRLIAGDLPLRAHEILENALQFELTGDTDEGSHTNLATVLANVRGTGLVIGALTPALRQRRPGLLTTIANGMRQLSGDLVGVRQNAGRWPAVRQLAQDRRERLDADIDGLLEDLAELPGILQLPVSLALP